MRRETPVEMIPDWHAGWQFPPENIGEIVCELLWRIVLMQLTAAEAGPASGKDACRQFGRAPSGRSHKRKFRLAGEPPWHRE